MQLKSQLTPGRNRYASVSDRPVGSRVHRHHRGAICYMDPHRDSPEAAPRAHRSRGRWNGACDRRYLNTEEGFDVRVFLLFVVTVALGCGGDSSTTTPAAPPSQPPPHPAPPPSAPSAPTGLRVSGAGEDFIEWAWNAVSGASSYDAHFSFFEDFGTYSDPVASLDASKTSFRRDGINTSTKGHLRVRSASETGATSAWSAHVTGETTEAAPTTPTVRPPPSPTADPMQCVQMVEKIVVQRYPAPYWDVVFKNGCDYHVTINMSASLYDGSGVRRATLRATGDYKAGVTEEYCRLWCGWDPPHNFIVPENARIEVDYRACRYTGYPASCGWNDFP